MSFDSGRSNSSEKLSSTKRISFLKNSNRFLENDDSSINILSSAKIISFLTHMILIKSREVILVNTLENKLKEKEESKNEINRVLERNNKKTCKLITTPRLKNIFLVIFLISTILAK